MATTALPIWTRAHMRSLRCQAAKAGPILLEWVAGLALRFHTRRSFDAGVTPMLLRRTKFSTVLDYEVLDDSGKVIGRIFLTVSPAGERWVWSAYGIGSGPAADTLEKAKDAFKAALARAKS
jgi:hypothetical protein